MTTRRGLVVVLMVLFTPVRQLRIAMSRYARKNEELLGARFAAVFLMEMFRDKYAC